MALSTIRLRKLILGHSRWSNLRKFLDLKLISSMYIWMFLVPIVAKLLSHIDVAVITVFDHTYTIPLSLPFSWQIFYFSAICFVFGNCLHRIKCPKLIHDYPTYSAYQEEGKPDWYLEEYAAELEIDFYRFKERAEEAMAEFGGLEKSETYGQRIFWLLYCDADKMRCFSLAVTQFLYIFGFILIGWVIFENFMWVLEYVSASKAKPD